MIPTSQPGPGSDLGGYHITGRLGHGAMADVYDAVDSTGHAVALKVFRAGGGMSPTMLERFRREAEATKKLRRHPYILTVYATGHEGDYHFIAMERVEDSRTLDSLMAKSPSTEVILGIGAKIASALQYAHEHQIVHRDVKPTNIMLDEFNEPMLADFGVAELMDWPSVTLSGALTGTPIYMSPEQARSEDVSPASDVYSLGVVLYEALTGSLPYDLPEAPATSVILDAVKRAVPIHPRRRTKRVSRDLDYVLMRSLKKDVTERYSTMREFMHDLEACLEGRPVAARWASPWTASQYWVRRNRTSLLGLVALALFGFAVFLSVQDRLRDGAYRELILKAVKTSADVKLAKLSTSQRTDPEMKSARKAMQNGRWFEARDLLQTAAGINRELNHPVPLAEAELELARCEIMLHNSLRALELYRQVCAYPEVGEAMVRIASFEAGMLMLLDGKRHEVDQLFATVNGGEEGPYLICMKVAMGLPTPDNWIEMRNGWQERLRMNALLAEVVRDRGRVPDEDLHRRLDQMVAEARNPQEWPLPFATYVRGRL